MQQGLRQAGTKSKACKVQNPAFLHGLPWRPDDPLNASRTHSSQRRDGGQPSCRGYGVSGIMGHFGLRQDMLPGIVPAPTTSHTVRAYQAHQAAPWAGVDEQIWALGDRGCDRMFDFLDTKFDHSSYSKNYAKY